MNKSFKSLVRKVGMSPSYFTLWERVPKFWTVAIPSGLFFLGFFLLFPFPSIRTPIFAALAYAVVLLGLALFSSYLENHLWAAADFKEAMKRFDEMNANQVLEMAARFEVILDGSKSQFLWYRLGVFIYPRDFGRFIGSFAHIKSLRLNKDRKKGQSVISDDISMMVARSLLDLSVMVLFVSRRGWLREVLIGMYTRHPIDAEKVERDIEKLLLDRMTERKLQSSIHSQAEQDVRLS